MKRCLGDKQTSTGFSSFQTSSRVLVHMTTSRFSKQGLAKTLLIGSLPSFPPASQISLSLSVTGSRATLSVPPELQLPRRASLPLQDAFFQLSAAKISRPHFAVSPKTLSLCNRDWNISVVVAQPQRVVCTILQGVSIEVLCGTALNYSARFKGFAFSGTVIRRGNPTLNFLAVARLH